MEKRATVENSLVQDQQDETTIHEDTLILDDVVDAQDEETLTEEEAQKPDNAAEIFQLKDQLLRALAETENVRRRAEKQVEDAGKYAVTNFARDLISVLENLYRASESITPDAIEETPLLKNISEGVEMTKRELLTVFERQGIKRIDPVLGEAFDPHLHQAVAKIPSPDNPSGSIAHVMQAGYIIKDRLLRPAMVAVAKEAE